LIHLSPAAFDASTFEIWGSLLHGSRCVLYPERVPTPEKLGQIIRNHKVDTLWLTCSLFNFIVDEAPETLEPVRFLFTGGEALSRNHVERTLKLLPGTRLINCYGPTETTTFATTHVVPPTYRAEHGPVPIGGPISNTSVIIVDQEDRLAPIGCEGELLIGGPGVALGYRRRPELTAERFVEVSDLGQDRFYRSGDRVYWRTDGTIAFVGRVDDQVKIRGFRIELGEVESELRKIDGVRRAAVVMVDEAPRGKALMGAVVIEPEYEGDADLIRGQLSANVPDFMVPTVIRAVDELPLNPNGKVDRKQLVALLKGSTPETRQVDSQTRRDEVPWREKMPGLPVEVEVEESESSKSRLVFLRLVREVLQIGSVDLTKSFVELGGDSLLAMRLVARASGELGAEIRPSDILSRASIEDIIPSLDRQDDQTLIRSEFELESVDRFSLWPLGPKQEHYVESIKAHPGEPVSVLGRALQISGELDPEALQKAVDWTVDRHETLRTVLVLTDGGQVAQKVLPHLPATVEWVPFEASDSDDVVFVEALSRFVRQGIDAFSGPLLHLRVLESSPSDHCLLFKVLHTAVDGALLPVLLGDLANAYNSFLRDESPTASLLTLQFLDFQVWRKRVLDSDRTGQYERFWKEQMQNVPAIGFPGFPSINGFRSCQARIRYFDFPGDMADDLRTFARNIGVTPFSVGLAAYAGLLKLYSGQNDFTIGTSLNLREDPRFDEVIGDFSNPIQLRIRLSEGLRLKDVLNNTIRLLALVMDHRLYPAVNIRKMVPKGRSNFEDPINNFIFSEMRDLCEGFDLSGCSIREIEPRSRLWIALMSTNYMDTGKAMRIRTS
jgi:NRPS condensation-like uncharacterized protein/acyl carrier protein